jgi:hypothetical protein
LKRTGHHCRVARIRRGFRPADDGGARGSAAADLNGLPDARTSLRGLTDEGDEAWLARAISAKLYRCPGCYAEIPIGAEHVVVHFVRRAGGSDHHHWHRECVERLLAPQLRGLRRVSARVSAPGRLTARGRRPAGRRR